MPRLGLALPACCIDSMPWRLLWPGLGCLQAGSAAADAHAAGAPDGARTADTVVDGDHNRGALHTHPAQQAQQAGRRTPHSCKACPTQAAGEARDAGRGLADGTRQVLLLTHSGPHKQTASAARAQVTRPGRLAFHSASTLRRTPARAGASSEVAHRRRSGARQPAVAQAGAGAGPRQWPPAGAAPEEAEGPGSPQGLVHAQGTLPNRGCDLALRGALCSPRHARRLDRPLWVSVGPRPACSSRRGGGQVACGLRMGGSSLDARCACC